MIEWERLKLVIEEKVHSLLIELQCETLHKRYVVVHQLVIILRQVEVCAPDQFVHERMREYVDYRHHHKYMPTYLNSVIDVLQKYASSLDQLYIQEAVVMLQEPREVL